MDEEILMEWLDLRLDYIIKIILSVMLLIVAGIFMIADADGLAIYSCVLAIVFAFWAFWNYYKSQLIKRGIAYKDIDPNKKRYY